MADIEKPGTALVNWDEILKPVARVHAGLETGPSGTFFSLRGGMLTFNNQRQPNDEIVCVILDSMFENSFYPGAFNPDAITPPKCFALSREEPHLRPHDVVFEHGQQEHDTCFGCKRNEYKSALGGGNGKACGNRRRLSLIAAGTRNNGQVEFASPDDLEKAPVALLRIPPTSLKAFATYARQITNVIERPLYGVVSLLRVLPDTRNTLRVEVSMLIKCPDAIMPVVVRRLEEQVPVIEQPYQLGTRDEGERPDVDAILGRTQRK